MTSRTQIADLLLVPAALRARLAAARAADSLEFEQAKLRLLLMGLVELYFVVTFLRDRILDDGELAIVALVLGIVALCAAHFGWVLLRPAASHSRWRVGALLDTSAVTLCMALADEAGAPLYGLYLWVIIGNGFRFGRWYLHYAQALALSGFAIVVYFSEFWAEHPEVSAALFLVLIAIPMYVSRLAARLRAASRRLQEARGEAEAANAAKTRFLAAASHDLRQPMQALSMYASVLDGRIKDPDTQRLVHGVQLSVAALERLFDSMLDIARIESGVVHPRVVTFPLMPLINHVVEAERPIAARKDLAVRVVRTSVSVRSDPVLLERMLKNLVTNAIRYTERGHIVIGCRRLGSERIRLEVADSGIGIPSQEQDRIFEEYYQLAGASTQGLGLGLSIVKGLGALLGHKVAVRSAPGRGSVFSIVLERAADLEAPAEAAYAPRPSFRGANVVVIDDDVEIRHSIGLLLESWDCRPVSGASAAEVERKLDALGVLPEALIVDYRLADPSDGLEVIAGLRRRFGAQLPALVITGTTNLAVLVARAGDIPIAVKPVPPGKLRAFLSQALREHSASHA
jgi:signal transduction histidine kinase/CheY-like chemotaxis protein